MATPAAPKRSRRMTPALDASSDGGTDRQFSISLSRGIDVLRVFTASEPALKSRAISDRTGLPKATVSRITYTLSRLGYLRQDENGAYRLATAVLSLCHPLLASMRLRQIARPILQDLATRSGCTVNLALCEGTKAIYVDSVQSNLVNPFHPDIGSAAPLLRSSIGRAMILAHQDLERAQLLNRIKIDDPSNFEMSLRYLHADEALMTTQGHCRGRGTWLPDIDAIATPIPLARGSEVAAISCTRPIVPHDTTDLEDFVPQLIEAARQIAYEFRSKARASE